MQKSTSLPHLEYLIKTATILLEKESTEDYQLGNGGCKGETTSSLHQLIGDAKVGKVIVTDFKIRVCYNEQARMKVLLQSKFASWFKTNK